MGYILIIAGIISITIGISIIRSDRSDGVWSTDASKQQTTSTAHRQHFVNERHKDVSSNRTSTSKKQPSAPHVDSESISHDIDSKKQAEEKGRKFEEWVIDRFNKEYFLLKEWRGDKYHNGVYAESTRYPDLEFELKLGTLHETIAVECKYRSRFIDGMEWATQEKIDIYNKYATERNVVVFVALGVGGYPDKPRDVYLVPLQNMQTPQICHNDLEPFRRQSTNASIYYFVSDKCLR